MRHHDKNSITHKHTQRQTTKIVQLSSDYITFAVLNSVMNTLNLTEIYYNVIIQEINMLVHF